MKENIQEFDTSDYLTDNLYNMPRLNKKIVGLRVMIVHQSKKGSGLLNKFINGLLFKLHIPGYRYCGSGTKLEKRLARGDPGVNLLDRACKKHDIAYARNKDNISVRNIADKILAEKAWSRVKASNSGVSERAEAFAITNAMKAKSTLEMGLKKRVTKKRVLKKKCIKKKKPTSVLGKIIKAASRIMSMQSNDARKTIDSALKAARMAVKEAGGKNQ